MKSANKQPQRFTIRRYINSEQQREVDETIASFPTQLKGIELDNVSNQIAEMYATGIWQNSKSLAVFSMNDEDNSLHDWVRRLAMLNVGSPSHTPKQGWLYNGTNEYTKSGLIPSTSGMLLDDSHYECYCYENLDAGDAKALFGVETGDIIQMLQRTNPLIQGRVNSMGDTNGNASLFLDNTRYGVHRANATQQSIRINGAEDVESSVNSSALPTKDVWIGGRQSNTATLALPINARAGYFHAMISPDLAALNTNLNLLESKFIV